MELRLSTGTTNMRKYGYKVCDCRIPCQRRAEPLLRLGLPPRHRRGIIRERAPGLRDRLLALRLKGLCLPPRLSPRAPRAAQGLRRRQHVRVRLARRRVETASCSSSTSGERHSPNGPFPPQPHLRGRRLRLLGAAVVPLLRRLLLLDRGGGARPDARRDALDRRWREFERRRLA